MRKIVSIIMVALVLSGCSLLSEVNQSLEYVNEATDYVTNLNEFAAETPQLIQEAANDPEVKEELESNLNKLKEEIEQFNEIDPPAIAQDIHEQIVHKNEQLLAQMDNAIENGELVIEKLKDSPIINTIQEMKELTSQIEQLKE